MSAVVVSRYDSGRVEISITESDPAPDETLDPEKAVTIAVSHSSVNFKDGLALAGNPGVMRINPLIPGIDAVGTVVDAPPSAELTPGTLVTVNGCGIGETSNGGFASVLRVPVESVIRVPAAFTAAHAAAIGTAGFTAALAVIALEHGGVAPGHGDVLVTGGSGGVGSIAIALLASAGYSVVASSGRPENSEYLKRLGASRVIHRSELLIDGKPLQAELWAGAIDSVGGKTLATVLAQSRYGATVAACGLVGGSDLETTVLPFILRAVSLAGINSVYCPRDARLAAWDRLARDLDLNLLDDMTTTIALSGVPAAAAAIVRGEVRGRTVVAVS